MDDNKRNEDIKKLWSDLVESAFDFFDKAIDAYKNSPKFAVLHLAASVELFLKSRLMAEHWTLILSKRSDPNFNNFLNGDFKSVTIGESIEKINGILPRKLCIIEEAKKEFTNLANERNKIAHFIHSKLTNKNNRNIVSQQCRVWYFLNLLLTETWKGEYNRFETRLLKLTQRMQNQKKFLEEKFKIIEPNLEIERNKYSIFFCDICEFESLVLYEDQSIFNDAKCRVCDYNQRVIKVKCPRCGKDGIVLEGGGGACSCGYTYSFENLAEIFGLSTFDDGCGNVDINCSDCGISSVYETDNDYVCLCCFELFTEIDSCQQCGECWTGTLSEFSFYLGCGSCHGWDPKD